ncbi:PucR family transcriptional regulator [Nocardia sp. alder85J]|uniref:PucR family transcriptional regulator n=1 Tax=Nocardia sp. alder85J TaxID=2862949 RepID=UPI001CD78B8A|nr:PucR family transcriptional regulator [Nocardia sp. alder85J]MCX4094423.1 helix-turn-helix domain-containing protein [Nocardia sp. alder85J]
MAIQEALRGTIDHLGRQPARALPGQLRMLLDISPRLCRSVLLAYHPARLDYFAAPPPSGRSAAVTLLDSSAIRPPGMTAATAYDVVAIRLSAATDQVVDRSPMRRFLRALRAHRDAVLPIVAESSGTLLVPSTRSERGLDDVLLTCGADAALTFTAATVHARRSELRPARDHAHQLLDLVEQLGCGPGLYRFADLAFEYQITRNGPGRDRLAAILDPLDDHPELLAVVEHHIRTGGVRVRTAELLGIHPMTLVNRLRRIRELTGLEPTEPTGRWHLHAALIAHLTRPTAPGERNTPPDPALPTAMTLPGLSPRHDLGNHAVHPASS